MLPISSINTSAVRPLTSARQAEEASRGQRPEEEPRPRKPDMDEYVPEARQGVQRCTGDSGEVDREIEKLKREKEELERRLSTEDDEDKIKDLKKRLAQVERELRQKDSDTYRRQHTAFS